MNFGGPEALEVFDLPESHAGSGEVRIRVHAATVNPTDTYTRNGARAEQLTEDPPPYVPGMDVAGIVDETGGICVPEGDTRALADALRLLGRATSHRTELGKRGRGRVEENYSMRRMQTRLEQIYRQVAKR